MGGGEGAGVRRGGWAELGGGRAQLLHAASCMPPEVCTPGGCTRHRPTTPATKTTQLPPPLAQATEALKITPDDLIRFGVMDEKIPEPLGACLKGPLC